MKKFKYVAVTILLSNIAFADTCPPVSSIKCSNDTNDTNVTCTAPSGWRIQLQTPRPTQFWGAQASVHSNGQIMLDYCLYATQGNRVGMVVCPQNPNEYLVNPQQNEWYPSNSVYACPYSTSSVLSNCSFSRLPTHAH
jgi:hypothetical protein